MSTIPIRLDLGGGTNTTKDAREEYGITSKFKVVWELLEHGWNLQVHLQKPE